MLRISHQTVIGLIASIGLTLRAIGLGRTPDNVGQQAVNSLGVLQTMWLLNRHPGLRTRIAAVKQPTDKNLRMAGRVRRSTDFCK
jgi:hypothetical protein